MDEHGSTGATMPVDEGDLGTEPREIRDRLCVRDGFPALGWHLERVFRLVQVEDSERTGRCRADVAAEVEVRFDEGVVRPVTGMPLDDEVDRNDDSARNGR